MRKIDVPKPLPAVGYLSDLRATLTTDVEAARALLARLVGSVILSRRGSQLLAESKGKSTPLWWMSWVVIFVVPGGGFRHYRLRNGSRTSSPGDGSSLNERVTRSDREHL